MKRGQRGLASLSMRSATSSARSSMLWSCSGSQFCSASSSLTFSHRFESRRYTTSSTTKNAEGVDNVAQLFVKLLEKRGVPALFANSGTDFTPLIDGLARYGDNLKLRVVLGTHENTVISMAHGYSLVSGKLTALMNHVTVGTANMGCGIINASRSKVPLLVCAGKTPWFDSGMKGSRTNFVQWGQDSYDQEGYFREYVKWDYELKHSHHFDVVFDRALAISQSEPKGPVYLSLPKEVLEMPVQYSAIEEVLSAEPHMTPDQPTVASDETLERAASLLLKSKSPVLLTAEVGRLAGGPEAVAAFCKEFGVGVVESGKRNYFNCDTEEGIHLGFDPRKYVNQADAIIVLECQVPWIPNFGIKPAPGVPVIQIGCDPLHTELPMRAFKSSLSVAGNPVLSLNRLAEILRKKREGGSFLTEAKQRVKNLAEEHQRVFNIARESARKEGEGAGAITKSYLSYCLGVALDDKDGDDTVIFNEYPLDHSLVPRRKPNSWFENSNASGLGWSFGACVGGKLARPDATMVCAVGDGSFLFNNPVACHHAATSERAPVLVIVFNDDGYSTIRKSTLGYKGQSPWCESTGRMPLVYFNNGVDYAKIAEACGGIGRTVRKPEQVLEAIREGLSLVRKGDKHVLLDIKCQRD